jgi:hypothetical protein
MPRTWCVPSERAFDIIETTPDQLREVDGIRPVRAASILATRGEQKSGLNPVRTDCLVVLPQAVF